MVDPSRRVCKQFFLLILLLLYEHSVVYKQGLIDILLVYEHGVVYKQGLLLIRIQLL